MTDHKFTDDDVIKTLKNAKYKVDGVVTRGYYLSPETFNAVVDLMGRQETEIKKLKDSRDRWKQIATDFDKASRETEKEIERLTTLAELGNMRANDYREMRNKLKKANAEIESLKKIGDDKTSEILRHATAIGELHKQLETAKSEAIKEFAKRLKAKEAIYFCKCGQPFVYTDLFNGEIDTLVKEMTEDKNA